jgi:hypothetical protein
MAPDLMRQVSGVPQVSFRNFNRLGQTQTARIRVYYPQIGIPEQK